MDHSEVKHLPKVDHTPAEMDQPSKLLLKAAALIEKRGLWCGGSNGTGGRCVLTALIDAEERTAILGPNGDEAFRRFAKSIGAFGDAQSVTRFVYQWNDSSSKGVVVSKLRSVALGG